MNDKPHLFTPDTAPKTGRKKGSKNRTNNEVREYLQKVVNTKMENLETDLELMTPLNRWLVLEKLLKYFLPQLSKNDNHSEVTGEIKIQVEYSE